MFEAMMNKLSPIRRLALFAFLALSPLAAHAQFSTNGSPISTSSLVNDGSTGTTINKLAKTINNAGVGNAVITGLSDTDGAIGVVVSNAGTTGRAQIAGVGVVSCAFDGTATPGHFVQISSSVAGDCHDSGAATRPTSGQVIGIVNTGGSGAATYTVLLRLGNPTPATLTFGTHLSASGSSYNGSAGVTIQSDATAANTASTIMLRDGSGQVAATTFTGALTGHSSLDLALTGGTMSGAIAMGTNAITGLTTLAGAGTLQFQSNGSTFAGNIDTTQRWYLGTANVAPPNANTRLTVSNNAAALPSVTASTMVVAEADATSANLSVQSLGTGKFSSVYMALARGTAASPTTIKSGDTIGLNFYLGYDGTTFVSGGGIGVATTEDWVHTTNQGARLDFYGTATGGSATAASNMHYQTGLMLGTTSDPGVGSLTLTGNIQARGTSPTGNTGTCTASSFTGGAAAGKFSAAVCAGGTFILSALPTAPNGYTCDAQDQTTPADTLKQTANTTTSVTFTSTTVASDVVAFKCIAW